MPVDVTDGKGDTLLVLAAHYGHAGTVRLLVTGGADSRRVSRAGSDAARHENESVVVKALPNGSGGRRAGSPPALPAAQIW
ncbi:hypothetical protein [Nonomuraea jabiensis]|uniref:hypothetical protein n=1 Tax=Nonomuraea jabiensis TaxID=882448 RepID=UPI003D7227AE